MLEYKQQVEAGALNAIFIEYEDIDGLYSYCWKPKIISNLLDEAAKDLDVLFWADSSTRFDGNPIIYADRIFREEVDFAGKYGTMGMGENTHAATYHWFGLNRHDFSEYREIEATYWFVNLHRPYMRQHFLQPWFDCAMACQQCMAPAGSKKAFTIRERQVPLGPPSELYVAHRQDQSVLGLLLYQLQAIQPNAARISIGDKQYFGNIKAARQLKTKSGSRTRR